MNQRSEQPPTEGSALSTAVYKLLNGVESWDQSTEELRTAFYREMKGKAYGFEALLDAWHWFKFGWNARSSGGASGNHADLVARLRGIGKGGEGYELTHQQFQTVARAADVLERLSGEPSDHVADAGKMVGDGAPEELERLRHYVATCGGTDNDGRCPMHHLAGVSPEPGDKS